MAKREKITAPENKEQGLMMQRSAAELAQKINDQLIGDLDMLNKAQADWEGGAFTVMHRITQIMTEEQISNLPDPKSETGNNPAHYLVPITKISPKGKRSEEWKKKYYYSDLALSLPGIVAKVQLKSQLERANGNDSVNKSDIPAEIMNLDLDYRASKARKLQTEIDGAVRNVKLAFELYHQLKKFGDLEWVECVPIWAIGPDGKQLNGAGGRPMVVESTKFPIVIRSTVDGREMTDRKEVAISTFLKYDTAKASETNGGTYEAVMNTVKREKPEEQTGHVSGTGNAQDQSRPQAINTADTANARVMDVYEFLHRSLTAKDKADWEALKKSVHEAGSDESFLSWRGVLHYARLLVGSPKDDARYNKLVSEMDDDEKEGLPDAA